MESALDSCLGANGAIYAIRQGLFWSDIPSNTIIDDFVIGMKVREQGYRMVYEPAAIAYEEFPAKQDEWRRRVRIGAGDFQALTLCRRCLLPRFGWFAWSFWSHKVLRWFTPHIGAFLVLGSWFLVARACVDRIPIADHCSLFTVHSHPALLLPAIVAIGSIVLLLFSVIGRVVGGESRVVRICRLCDHFVAMQAAIFVGFVKFCRGGLQGAWERTPRGGANR
jgi:cellulose synthase/poly-beta-1,6-N-acetylglucosamine synthase-like glycosyltransferase